MVVGFDSSLRSPSLQAITDVARLQTVLYDLHDARNHASWNSISDEFWTAYHFEGAFKTATL